MTQLRVAILGATGAVGRELLHLIEQRDFPVSSIRLLASPRSTGKTMRFRGQNLPVLAVSEQLFDSVDVAFFSAGGEAARTWAGVAQGAGALVIDNSSAFRMDPKVPLIVPEINWHRARPEVLSSGKLHGHPASDDPCAATALRRDKARRREHLSKRKRSRRAGDERA